MPGAGLTATSPGQDSLEAILWDVDGTLAETERDGHLVAFNEAFAAEGLPWRWDDRRYGELLAITGGRERLLHDLGARPEAPTSEAGRDQLARHLHRRKNAIYADIVASGRIALRPGVRALMDECQRAGVTMAITTTTTRASVEALLHRQLGGDWQTRFATLVCAEDVARKKPDPAVFRIAVERLGVVAARAVAIEDSPNGVMAATAAGCPVIVTRSVYFADSPIAGALAVGPGLDRRDGWSPAVTGGTEGDASGSGEDAGGEVGKEVGKRRIGLADVAGWLAAFRPPPAGQVDPREIRSPPANA